MSSTTRKCPEIPDDGCSICGPEMCVTDFDSIFSFPGQPSVPCGDLEKAGHAGLIPQSQCPFLPALVSDICKCKDWNLRPLSPPTVAPLQKDSTYHAPIQIIPTYPTPTGQVQAPSRSPNSPTNLLSSNEACPDVPDYGCSVCGPGMCVTNSDAIFEFPGQPAVHCGALESAGLNGIVPLDQCGFLPGLILDLCKCKEKSLRPISPTRPTPTPTHAPLPNNKCQSVPDDGCSVCGPGMCVTNYDGIFEYPGQPAVRCGDLERAGLDGIVPLDQCGFLPALVMDECKCRTNNSGPTSPSRIPATRPPSSSISWPEIPNYPPFSTTGNVSTVEQSKESSQNLVIGLTVGASLLGVLIIALTAYLVRKNNKTIKEASTIGLFLEADGSSMMEERKEVKIPEFGYDPDL